MRTSYHHRFSHKISVKSWVVSSTIFPIVLLTTPRPCCYQAKNLTQAAANMQVTTVHPDKITIFPENANFWCENTCKKVHEFSSKIHISRLSHSQVGLRAPMIVGTRLLTIRPANGNNPILGPGRRLAVCAKLATSTGCPCWIPDGGPCCNASAAWNRASKLLGRSAPVLLVRRPRQ